jgi:hypothetical protein
MGIVTKTGSERNKSNTLMVNGSCHVPRRNAAQIPAGRPMAKMMIRASRLYWTVTHIFSKMMSSTATPR